MIMVELKLLVHPPPLTDQLTLKKKLEAHTFSELSISRPTAEINDQTVEAEKKKADASTTVSEASLQALKSIGVKRPTKIQRLVLRAVLEGQHNVLATAKTGSGKTLAFMLPLVERLLDRDWRSEYGLFGLVVTPTRELAKQCFEVLRHLACGADKQRRRRLAAGVICGDGSEESVKAEQKQLLGRVHVIVCTPGRALHHLEQGALCLDSVEMVVLDEADRLLSGAFLCEMLRLSDYLPSAEQRQTLLFSATQEYSRDGLEAFVGGPGARPTLMVHANPQQGSNPTQRLLKLDYMIARQEDKVELLWRLLRRRFRRGAAAADAAVGKMMVFLGTCKLVRFVYAAFHQLDPSLPLLELHGGMKQARRDTVYQRFCASGTGAMVLLCTDVAARGLHFSNVDAVLQLDAPSDPETFVHRAGRTARAGRPGYSTLVLLPSEKRFLRALEAYRSEHGAASGPPLSEWRNDSGYRVLGGARGWSLKRQWAHSELAPELRLMAVRAVRTCATAYTLHRNRAWFPPDKVDWRAFAHSLGLFELPSLSQPVLNLCGFEPKAAPEEVDNFFTDKPEVEGGGGTKEPLALAFEEDDDENEVEDVLKARQNKPGARPLTRVQLARRQLRKGIVGYSRKTFDSDDGSEDDTAVSPVAQLVTPGMDIEAERLALASRDVGDRRRFQKLQKSERLARKIKKREQARKEKEARAQAHQLDTASVEGDEMEADFEGGSDEEGSARLQESESDGSSDSSSDRDGNSDGESDDESDSAVKGAQRRRAAAVHDDDSSADSADTSENEAPHRHFKRRKIAAASLSELQAAAAELF